MRVAPASSRRAPREEHSLKTSTVKVAQVKGQIKARRELKFLDTSFATYTFDTTGTVTLLNPIAEGDDNINRNSRSVLVKSVAVRGFVAQQPNAVAANTLPQKARLLLVWDNAANGALALATDVMVAINAMSFPNVNNEKRFTILFDQSYAIGPFATTATQSIVDNTVKDIEGLVNLNAPVEFIGTTGAIASIGNGALLAITLGTSATGANAAYGSLAYRVRFQENDSL